MVTNRGLRAPSDGGDAPDIATALVLARAVRRKIRQKLFCAAIQPGGHSARRWRALSVFPDLGVPT